MHEFDAVRIVKLIKPVRGNICEGDPTARPPQIGDIGVIVDMALRPDGVMNHVVEKCDSEGYCIWLCDFDAEEIEPV